MQFFDGIWIGYPTFEFLHDLLERVMRMLHIKVEVQRVQQHSLRYHHFLLESEELFSSPLMFLVTQH